MESDWEIYSHGFPGTSMTSLGTLELQLTADQSALYQQLNQAKAYATQVAKDIEKQINQAFSGAGGQNSLTGLNQATAQAASAGQTAGKTFMDRFKNAIEPIKSILSNVFNGVFVGAGIGAFNSITGAVGSAMGTVQQFAGEVLNVTKDFQGFESSLKTFLKGNQKEIDDFVSKLEKFAATTPFELKDLQQAAIQNLATGAKPDQIIKDLKSIGDVAAGANAQLGDLMEVYAKSRTEGKLQNEDIDQFTGRGVQLVAELGKMLGARESEIRQLATDGKLEFRHLEEALRRMSAEGGVYFGAMENKAKTLEGRLSNVNDTFYQFQKSIGQAFEPIMNYLIQTFGDIISSLTSSKGVLEEVKKEAEELVKYFKANPELIEVLNKAIQELVGGVMKGLLALIKSMAEYLRDNPTAIKDTANQAGKLLNKFGDLLNILGKIGSAALNFLNIIKEAFGFLNKSIDKLDSLTKGIPGLENSELGNFLRYGPLGTSAVQGLLKKVGINLPGFPPPQAQAQPQASSPNSGNGNNIIGNIVQGVQGFFGLGSPPPLQSGGSTINQPKYKIVESVGSRNEKVTQYSDLEPHHPSVVKRGGHKNRPYGIVEGRKEELNPLNRNLIKKDFILINPQGKQYGVPVPSPVTGYAGQVGQGWGAVNLYADKEMTKLIAQVGHMINLQVKNGQLVQYGQTLGGQAGMGIKGANTYGTHVDMSTDPETYRRYIGDLQTGVFKGTGQNLFQQGVNAAKQILTPVQNALPTSNAKPGNAVLWGQAANYSPSDLSNLTKRGNKAMEALKNPNVRAFLDAVAIAEVGTKGASRGGYGYLIGDDVKGKESFDPNSLQSHPRIRIRYGPGKNEVSSATGRYQTMDFVWDEEAKRLGLKDFKPQSQEILAVSRLIYRGILPAIMAGDFKSVIKRRGKMDASSEWASLEGNPHGQGSPTGKLGLFLSNIEKNLQSQKTQSTPQQSSASSQSSVSQQPTNSQSPVSQQTANSNQQTPGPATGGTPIDQVNLNEVRRNLWKAEYNKIKEEFEAANEESDNREKQNRELAATKRTNDNKNRLAEFAANEALAPDAAKKNIQKQAELYKINNSFEEELIKKNQELEDRIGDREMKLKILAEAKKRKVTVLPSDAGVDYSKSINQLKKEIEEIKKRRDLELATYDLNQFNADKEIEKNKARQREIEGLSRAHEAYINQLRLEQSLADDGMKQNIQSKIDKAQIEHQAKITLMSLQNQLDDLQDDKVYLLGKGGLNADSDQVKKLQKDINELVATINSIKDNTSIDLKIFENQLKQVEEQNRRLKESVLINSEAQSLSGQAQLIRVEQGNEYKASALEAEAAKMQEQLRYKQELLQIEQQIAAVKGTANEYTEQEIAALKANAETINKINLKGISQQVRTLGRDLLDVSKNALGTFFSDIISGSKSAGDAFDNLVDNIIQQLIQLATNEFIKQIIPTIFGAVGSIFAGGAGAGAGGGEVLVAYQGGIIPNYANGGSVGAVADALHRERSMSGGKTPVLAALTPGEMVLTIEQTKRFQELRLDKVLNFANGGVVGGGQNLSNEIGSKNMTINIPVTVEGGGDSSVNVPRLQDSLRSVVLAEIQKQQRPGGALNK